MFKTVLSSPIHFLAFGFGSGLLPFAPGTAGTVVAAVLYVLFLQHIGLAPYLLLTLVVIVVGVWLCGESSRRLGVHDHSGIVWDEFAGFMITMIAIPQAIPDPVVWVVLGFAFFRLFDIWKPWPIRRIDRDVSGGLGIMLDDILAGVYAAFCLQACIYFWG